MNVWFGGPSGVHRAAFDAAIAAGAPVGGPGLVVWGLGQPFEQYAPPPEVALEHARQCVVRARVLALHWGAPAADTAQIVHEARRLGRALQAVDLALANDLERVAVDLANWLISGSGQAGPQRGLAQVVAADSAASIYTVHRPHLYVVGGEQELPMSPFYRRARELIARVLRLFPRERSDP